MKRHQTSTIKNASIILILIALALVGIHSLALAKTTPIMVTDHDRSADFSIGDEFCIGNECFYIISNDGTSVKALSKYNIEAGGDTYDVSQNPKYQNIPYDWQLPLEEATQYSDGFSTCDWDYTTVDGQDYVSATRCYKQYNIDISFIDLSDREDYGGITPTEFINKTDAEFGEQYYCNYGSEYDQELGQRLVTQPRYCYSESYVQKPIKQNPEMLSAHNDDSGKLIFPMRGNVYWHDAYYDATNNLLLSDEYRNQYTSGDNTWDTHTEVSYYIYQYADYLKQIHNIDGIYMMTYNDLMHILNGINEVGANFTDNNYLLEEEGFTWQERPYDEGANGSYSYYFASMLNYIPEQYKWIYDSTYWLSTAWYTDTDKWNEADDGSFKNGYNKQFFINTRGDLCSVQGYCGNMNIPAGIRPVIALGADQLLLNTSFDINGTIRWEDDKDASRVRPLLSTIRLLRNGIEIDSIEVAKEDDEDLWRFSFRNLLKYDNQGNEYEYAVAQDDIPLYSSNVNNYNIVNRYSPNGTTNPDTIDSSHTYIFISCAAILIGTLIIKRQKRRQ